uniref:non-specific serine/threonine protein kinase n=1 Tax=Leersia perrieri TaxID=77586 RepID=A0A0D9V3Y5_9ORYZ
MARLLCLVILPLIIVLLSSHASAQSTLSTGSSIPVEKHKQTFLTSPNADFSCGFYEVGRNAFSFSIWFANSKEKTVVWSANPKSPVNGHGSKVTLNNEGNLVLTDVNGTVNWDSKTSSGKGTTVVLLDTGNLIIRDSTGTKLWQSFSAPTDTLLPLQPLTKGTRLVSGYFNLYFDNDNVLRLMYDGPEVSSIYWPSPDYNVFDIGRTRYNSSRNAVLDTEGHFLSSDQLNIKASDWGPGIKRRLTLDYDGNLRMYSLNVSDGSWTVSWQTIAKLCDVHGLCGENGICQFLPRFKCFCPPGYEMKDPTKWNRGCRPLFVKNCSKTEEFEFVKLAQTDFYGFDLTVNHSISLKECKRTCLEICSCLALTYKTGSGTCYTKNVLYNGYSSTNYPGDNYIKVPKNMVSKHSDLSCNPSTEIVLGSATVLGALVAIFAVRMWGFCSEDQHKLLVYEYVENESLDKYLFGNVSTERLLAWNQRFKIAWGTARGLAYLHHECLEWVVHCDIKPENILLTRDFEAKIADFGLAKLSKRDNTSLNFTHMRGTMGYMAPEWALNSPITAKVDVYSYGVVLLEIVTGSRISSGIKVDGKEVELREFVQAVKQILASGDVKDIIDTRLNGYFNSAQAKDGKHAQHLK